MSDEPIKTNSDAKRSVWLVSMGEYSGYGIDAAFSTEEAAAKYCGSLSDQGKGYFELFLDEHKTDELVRVYVSCVELHSGEKREHRTSPWLDYTPTWVKASEAPSGRGEYYLADYRGNRNGDRPMSWGCSNVSQEHAEKLAVEGRQAWLRLKAMQEQGATL